MLRVDLNRDLDESYGAYTIGLDEMVLPLISSANVACGFHAGDPLVMQKTVSLAKAAGTAIGAHPGFPDLQGFGRRNMALSPAEVKASVLYQVGALKAFAEAEGLSLQHVKPHGALYNMSAKDMDLARAVCEAVAAVDKNLILMGLYGSCHIEAARELGLPYAHEVFADRAYEEDGSLVSRSKPGAMIHDEHLAIRRVLRMIKENKVEAITGRDIPIQADSICVHGDNPRAVEFVKGLRAALTAEGITICSLSKAEV